ncbi:MAG TPA: hypothetical protein VFX61_03385 [Micromonosporaceae bacterium]|nr:hypothetical protein [Micromonosporaceae bacterium]
MERERLVSLLAGRGSAYEDCRAALRRDASFVIYDSAVPANLLAHIYRRRETHVRERGLPTLGFRQAVDSLHAAGNQPLRLGAVRVADPPSHFQLFVSADGSTVVACLAVAQ